jgi:hypothetical protein
MNKIDSVNNSDLLFTQPTMKPVYSTNIELLCGVIVLERINNWKIL